MTTSRAAKVKRISAAQAKAQLSELLARVAYGGEQYVIERRGKPVAALVSVEDLNRLEPQNATQAAQGALALVGLWADLVTKEEMNDFLTAVYAERERDRGRPVELKL